MDEPSAVAIVEGDAAEEVVSQEVQSAAQPPEPQLPPCPALDSDVARFLQNLHDYVYDRDVVQIQRLYEKDFNDITNEHFKVDRWPGLDTVYSYYVSNGRYHDLIMTLYRELYFRHVVSNCAASVSAVDRVNSSTNYGLLLNYFIEDECSQAANKSDGLKLPDQWLWDILDEYVYQYQEMQRWRHKTAGSSESGDVLKELQQMIVAPNSSDPGPIWETTTVIVNLQSLVQKSRIKQKLTERENNSGPLELDVPETLGYFAMVSALRLHVLLGDYSAALSAVNGLDFGEKPIYSKIPACHITLFYNLGFAYMMLRRYSDAVTHFMHIISFVNGNRNYLSSQSYQKDAMTKTVDKMCLLLMLCVRLSPGRVDDSTMQYIKDKQDKYFKHQGDDDESYKEAFLKACPKFVDPSLPAADNEEQYEDPQKRQLSAFMRDVRFQRKVLNVRSFAKLYNNIQLQKLGSLMDIKEKNAVDIVRSELLCVKHRGRQVAQAAHNHLLKSGCAQTLPDVDFYVESDVVHVKNVKPQPIYVDWFMKQMLKAQDLIQELTEPGKR